jgi:hypothetical protein
MITARQPATAILPAEGASAGLTWSDKDQMIFGEDGLRLP